MHFSEETTPNGIETPAVEAVSDSQVLEQSESSQETTAPSAPSLQDLLRNESEKTCIYIYICTYII